MTMKEFNEYLRLGIAKKQSPNVGRARSLIDESDDKYQYVLTSLSIIPKEKLNANVILDQCYDVLMELIRAKMHIEGYNAGSSHEAEVSYLQVLGFSAADVRFMNELRYYRNGTKYYGTKLDMQYAEQTIVFMKKVRSQMKILLEKNK